MKQRQFSLLQILSVVTFFSALFALTIRPHPLVVAIATGVIIANVLGFIAALTITHGLGFPRDGTLRDKSDVEETDSF